MAVVYASWLPAAPSAEGKLSADIATKLVDLNNFDETSNAQDNSKEINSKNIFNRLERQPGRMQTCLTMSTRVNRVDHQQKQVAAFQPRDCVRPVKHNQ